MTASWSGLRCSKCIASVACTERSSQSGVQSGDWASFFGHFLWGYVLVILGGDIILQGHAEIGRAIEAGTGSPFKNGMCSQS